MTAPTHIVAVGARTPLGTGAASSAAAIRARISRLREHPILVDPRGEPIVGAIDDLVDPLVTGWRRIAALCGSALTEVLEQLAPVIPSSCSARVLLAFPETRPGFTDADMSQLIADVLSSSSTAHSLRGLDLRCTGRGNAAGLQALSLAAEQLHRGEVDLCIVGGADSYFHPETLNWLMSHNLLSRRGVRSGFSPGEGASFVALVSDTTRRRWRMDSLGVLHGLASAHEEGNSYLERESLGLALTRAVTGATTFLRPPQERVTDIFCDINGERVRTEEWGFAVLRASHVLTDGSTYHAPASYWGDQGAASGPLLAVLAAQAWKRGYARGPYTLLWAASRQGLRSAAVLKKPER